MADAAPAGAPKGAVDTLDHAEAQKRAPGWFTARVVELARAGLKVSEISSQVRATLRRAMSNGLLPKIDRPDGKKNPCAFTANDRESILGDWAAGLSAQEIAVKRGVSGSKPASRILRCIARAAREGDLRQIV